MMCSSMSTFNILLLIFTLQVSVTEASHYQKTCLKLADDPHGNCVGEGLGIAITAINGIVKKSCPSTLVKIPVNFDGYEPNSTFGRVCQCVGKCGEDAHCTQIEGQLLFPISANKEELLRIPVDCLCVKKIAQPAENVDLPIV